MISSQQPIVVSLNDLKAGTINLSTLQQAFGPSSLGILIVRDLPKTFEELRLKLLSYASHLANLPSEELDRLTDAASHYNVGWSHGKEALKSGQYDTMKGSYYVGVLSSYLQATIENTSLADRPSTVLPNIWPSEKLLPGFRKAFEELCTMITDIALLVARACDVFAAEYVIGYKVGTLERIVRDSTAARARLLHYFPSEAASSTEDSGPKDEEMDSWCASHVDDGCLTGLVSALFVDESSPLPPVTGNTVEPVASVKSPDPLSGLYIRSRTSNIVKVNIPPDCLAFQTGTALELMTGGAMKAVPHFVRGPSASRKSGEAVSRNTLAVFMQPALDETVDAKTGMTFGEHIRLSDEKYA